MGKPIDILIPAFNRPHLLKQSLDHLETMNLPIQVWVSIDGPRCSEDTINTKSCARVAQNSSLVVDLKIGEQNLGIYEANKKAIDYFFAKVDFGLILEDDLLISRDFLVVLPELNNIYRDCREIISISAMNWMPHIYNFRRKGLRKSIFFNSTGWATWQDRWLLFDANPTADKLITSPGSHIEKLQNLNMRRYWINVLDSLGSGSLDSWAYRWELTSLTTGKFSLELPVNLCVNLGSDEMSTNTKIPSRWLPHRVGRLKPSQISEFGQTYYSKRADKWLARNHYQPWILRRVINKIQLLIALHKRKRFVSRTSSLSLL